MTTGTKLPSRWLVLPRVASPVVTTAFKLNHIQMTTRTQLWDGHN